MGSSVGHQSARNVPSERQLEFAIPWLKFLGRLEQPASPPSPYAEQIAAFADYMHSEQDLSARTVGKRCQFLQRFLGRFGDVGCLREVQPTPVMALVVSGMNDVLNSQGYTQAAHWNQIPTAAWALMAAIAIGCNLLVGYGSRSAKAGSKLLPILPIVVSIAFMLIADIDSPRHGIIRVSPQNLISLAKSLLPPSEMP